MLCFVSCSKDSEPITENNIEIAHLLHEQLPESAYDESIKGLYHGAVLSTSSTSRGKIWVNIAQKGVYNALIKLATGESLVFDLYTEFSTPAEATSIYRFSGEAGSFSIDLSDFHNPVIDDLSINGETYYSHLVKSMSSNPASVLTAVFLEYSDPMFSGTWSVIADGSIVNPNGDNGDGITSVMVVYDGVSFTDTIMDSINATSCLGNGSYIPTVNSFGVAGSVVSDYQNTVFAGGMAKWDLSYDATTDTYMDYRNCNSMVAGTFSWTSPDNSVMKTGEIILD
jgi:hypothetical protein